MPLGDFFKDYGKDIFGTAGAVAAGQDIRKRLEKVGSEAQQQALAVGREAQTGTAFKPFTVSTGFGGLGTTADGSTTTTLSPELAAQQQALQGITSGLLGGFGGLTPKQTTHQMFGTPRPGGREMLGGPAEFTFSKQSDLGPQALQALSDPTGISQGAFGQAAGMLGGPAAGQAGIDALSAMALGQAPGMFQGAMGDMGSREADIYSRIRATQAPEEQRQQLALEERLAAQGRTGLRTAQFGGSPEQLAMEKARAEAMNQASLAAMGQAGTEQERQFAQAQAMSQLGLGAAQAGQGLQQGQLGLASGMFGLGSQAQQLPYQMQGLQQGLEAQRLANVGAGMGLTGQQLANIGQSMGLSYMPEQQLLASLTPGLEVAGMADVARRQGAGLLGEAGITGVEARLGAELGAGEILGGMYQSALSGLFGG